MIEISALNPRVDVLTEEYVRLLGYPRDHVLSGRALELANGARDWYRKFGRPWIHAREASAFDLREDSFVIDGSEFGGSVMRRKLATGNVSSVVVAAVSAGPEVEAESQRLWLAEKPDEYFFLEVYGSAVVEHLVTVIGAQICGVAEGEGRAVLPHYSPGYPEWLITEQAKLFSVLSGGITLPGALEVMESGMLRPKKSLLAIFGLTRETEKVRALSELNPCTGCALPNCQYRRVAYRRPRSRALAEI
jgi:hypothetical protein